MSSFTTLTASNVSRRTRMFKETTKVAFGPSLGDRNRLFMIVRREYLEQWENSDPEEERQKLENLRKTEQKYFEN